MALHGSSWRLGLRFIQLCLGSSNRHTTRLPWEDSLLSLHNFRLHKIIKGVKRTWCVDFLGGFATGVWTMVGSDEWMHIIEGNSYLLRFGWALLGYLAGSYS
jgi:hypothetical protein